MKIANVHLEIELGNNTGGENARNAAISAHAIATGYRPLGDAALAQEGTAYTFSGTGSLARVWDLNGTTFSQCLSFM